MSKNGKSGYPPQSKRDWEKHIAESQTALVELQKLREDLEALERQAAFDSLRDSAAQPKLAQVRAKLVQVRESISDHQGAIEYAKAQVVELQRAALQRELEQKERWLTTEYARRMEELYQEEQKLKQQLQQVQIERSIVMETHSQYKERVGALRHFFGDPQLPAVGAGAVSLEQAEV